MASIDNPINSISSRIDGYQIGLLKDPVKIGSYKYHFTFKNMEDGYNLIEAMAPTDEPSIVTSDDRPNMYLIYNSFDQAHKLVYHSWCYWEYVHIRIGHYGSNYYLFGNGKFFQVVPEKID